MRERSKRVRLNDRDSDKYREWAERWNYNDNTSTKYMYNYKMMRKEMEKRKEYGLQKHMPP